MLSLNKAFGNLGLLDVINEIENIPFGKIKSFSDLDEFAVRKLKERFEKREDYKITFKDNTVNTLLVGYSEPKKYYVTAERKGTNSRRTQNA